MPSNCATRKDGRRNGEMKLLSIVLWNRPQSTPESPTQTLSVDTPRRPRDAVPPAPGALGDVITLLTWAILGYRFLNKQYY